MAILLRLGFSILISSRRGNMIDTLLELASQSQILVDGLQDDENLNG